LRDAGLPLPDAARAAAEGAEMARFVPNPYRTSPRKERDLAELLLLGGGDLEAAVREGQVVGRAKNLARDLVNEPGNVLTPTELARRAVEAAEAVGLQHQVLDEAQL